VWSHRQVLAWRTTAATRGACPCQYPDCMGGWRPGCSSRTTPRAMNN